MFDKLLLESLHTISQYLDFEEQLTLALTCKAIYNVFANNILYQDLRLDTHPERAKFIFQKFSSKTLNGEQVKRLTIRSPDLPSNIFQKLPLVFPNVQELNDKMKRELFKKRAIPKGTLNNLYSWKDTLEKLYMDGDYSHFSHLLEKENTVPSCLTYLSISPFKDFNAGTEARANLSLCIKNTPSLKHLRLYHCIVDLKFLEDMHAAIPQLETLSLSHLVVSTTKDSLPSPLEPATQLMSLELEKVTCCDEKMVFLDYINNKYTQLKKLTLYEIDGKNNYSDFHEFTQGQFPELSKEQHEDISEDADEECKKTHATYYKSGAKTFLSKLPSTLKELTMDACIFDKIPEAFAIANIQPEHVEFLQDTKDIAYAIFWDLDVDVKCVFGGSRHFKFLSKWATLTSLKLVIDDEMNRFLGTVYSTSLTHLELKLFPPYGESDGVHIDQVLASFPSLTHLKMEGLFAIMESKRFKKASTLPDYSSLRCLDLTMSMLFPELVEFIVTVAPNLKVFIWNARVTRNLYRMQNIVQIPMIIADFSTLNLDKFQLIVHFKHQDDNLQDDKDRREYERFLHTENKVFLETHNGDDIKKYTFIAEESGKCEEFATAEDLDQEEIRWMVRTMIKHNNNIKRIAIGTNILL